jgi:hypothetical protein
LSIQRDNFKKCYFLYLKIFFEKVYIKDIIDPMESEPWAYLMTLLCLVNQKIEAVKQRILPEAFSPNGKFLWYFNMTGIWSRGSDQLPLLNAIGQLDLQP